jgi:hypothetical protein
MSKQDESVNFLENINGLYGGNTYLEKNGMSIIIASVILIIVFSIITYSEISNHLNIIKQDWPTNRCNPKYIPLAGLINAPPGESKWAYTAQNFSFCINNILGDITGFITNPTKMIASLITAIMGVVSAIMAKLSEFISTIRTDIMNFARDVVARVLNLLVPIIQMWHKIYDIFKRTTGVMGFIFYFVDLVFFTVISWVNLVVKVITDWVLFVFEVMGITGLILMIPLLILMVQMIIYMLFMLAAMVMEALGIVFPPFTLPIGAIGVADMTIGGVALFATSTAYLITAAVSFIATTLILIVIQVYDVFVIDPMMDFLDLFPGFINTPSDKNPGDLLWWANAINLTKHFVKPVGFSKTSDIDKSKSSSSAIKSGKGSPSGMSITSEMTKGKSETFRNMFY